MRRSMLPLCIARPGGVLLEMLSSLASSIQTRTVAAEQCDEGGVAWVLPGWVGRVNDVKLIEHRVLGDAYDDQLDHFWMFRYVGLCGAEPHTVVTPRTVPKSLDSVAEVSTQSQPYPSPSASRP